MTGSWMALAGALVVAACGDDGGEATPHDAGGDAAVVVDPRPVPIVDGSTQLCKLFSNLRADDPTANDTHHRSNILGADLGIPIEHAGQLFIFFGDTIGFRGIWGAESHPDSVGYGLDSAAAIAANPALLCSRLRLLTLGKEQSVGDDLDPTIEGDFAGVAMIPPPGQGLEAFIRNPAGGNGGPTFANLPGDFEVPSGAFSVGDAIYVFYTTVVSPQDITMKGSYLARWDTPSPQEIPSLQIVGGVDQRFDAGGALGGNFINIAAVTDDTYVYAFGTGDYRKSPVHVARKRLDQLATAGGFEVLAAGAPIIATPAYGETSVRYFAAVDRWMLLAEELTPTSNRIVAHVAARPEGPWSAAITLLDMGDPAFRGTYCCAPENTCTGPQFLNCSRTGFYGAYLLPEVALGADGSFTITYTLSSFDPYNVALFQTTFTQPSA